MDPADVIASFATGNYVVTRRATGTFDHGEHRPGATSTFSIVAGVQPASGRDLLRLPEERRSVETRIVFTSTQLLVARQGGANDSDLIEIEGDTWEVQHAESWRPAPIYEGSFYRCIVQAVG